MAFLMLLLFVGMVVYFFSVFRRSWLLVRKRIHRLIVSDQPGAIDYTKNFWENLFHEFGVTVSHDINGIFPKDD